MKRIFKSIRVLFVFVGILLCLPLFVGCSEEELKDGDWPPIQFMVNETQCKKNTFNVSPEGGEYKLYSKNYGILWLMGIDEDSNPVWPTADSNPDFMKIHLERGWYEVQYDEQGNIVVSILPLSEEVSSRSLRFQVECGDAFGSFTFMQNKEANRK